MTDPSLAHLVASAMQSASLVVLALMLYRYNERARSAERETLHALATVAVVLVGLTRASGAEPPSNVDVDDLLDRITATRTEAP